ncbi:MAG: pyruvate kinase, partial [Alphaproteobacteria bacterium]|nr:pyruvate kinase [Alphaproteobacteria bacterium]
VARVRRAAMQLGNPTGILLDLQGPKIRTSKVPEPLDLHAGDILTVVMVDEMISRDASDKRVGTTYPEMAEDVRFGDRVLFADGALQGEVVAVRREATPKEVDIRIDVGGPLGSNKGINLPGVKMSVPCLTEKDIGDLEVGLEIGVDYVALSFVRRPADIEELKRHMERIGTQRPIIAKIEKPEAVENIDAICSVANGVMVARGDLGVEVRIEKVPVYQKHIIDAAHRHGALCITATQMLDSMERNPRPTRAETTDVANAILDRTDAVMLSGETAVGLYPVEAVRMMDSIAREVEDSRFFEPTPLDEFPPLPGPSGIVARAGMYAAAEGTRPLLIFTSSGMTALYAAKARPRGPIFALTPYPEVADRLALAWGVTPVVTAPHMNVNQLIAAGERVLLARGDISPGEEIVIIAGQHATDEVANLLKIHNAGEARRI